MIYLIQDCYRYVVYVLLNLYTTCSLILTHQLHIISYAITYLEYVISLIHTPLMSILVIRLPLLP
jgi:hypothetical protein